MLADATSVSRGINVRRFRRALEHVLAPSKHGRFPKLGLALSGGVDSMALVYLWSELVKSEPAASGGSRAFIVDHQARAGSSEEALRVSDEIKRLTGQPAQILKLEWPSGTDIKGSNFETLARRLRFRALGKACQSHGIGNLVLAHHADDCAETMLWRLATRHYGHGLMGIAGHANIPECEDLYGVHESGARERGLSSSRPRILSSYESGGVKLVRPLLDFSKDDLITTCKENGVSWVEDATNQDSTLTVRNAVRQIFRSAKLPDALTKPKLAETATQVKQNVEDLRKIAARLLRECEVHSMDICGGVLTVSIPTASSVFDKANLTDRQQLSDAEKYFVCCTAVQKLVQYVSSANNTPLDRLGSIVNVAFPDAFPMLDTIYGRRAKANSVETLVERKSAGMHMTTVEFRREPLSNKKRLPMVLFDAPEPTTFQVDVESGFWDHYTATEAVKFGATALWDARFWMRMVTHRVAHPLAMVPLGKTSLAEFAKALSKGGKRPRPLALVEKELRLRTKDRSRDTLPALVVPPGAAGVAAGTIVALPTLGLVRPDYRERVSWVIAYKKIDAGQLRCGSNIVSMNS